MKQCAGCNNLLDFSNFYNKPRVSKKTGANYIWYDKKCKACRIEKAQKSPSRELEKRKEYLRGWRIKNKDKLYLQQREYHLLKTYSLTIKQYDALREQQHYCCAICGEHESTKHVGVGKTNQQALYVDHDHTTGKIRQLLCLHCNSLLGKCNDNKSILVKAISYLERHTNAE
jgi:hypothetical protein